MTSSVGNEYLEKYSVAPSPSRDYYGIKVIRDQVILYTWRISHGPHTSPIVRMSRFCDFSKDKTMHSDIERVFGEPIFRHVQTIARGNGNTLLTLPKHLIKKLITYLTFKDVLKLSAISHMAKEVFNGDIVWEVLYRRHKMGLVYRDEREQGSSYGWKRLFKERQMHKSAKNRKMKNLSNDHHPVAPRPYTTSMNKKNQIFFPLKNPEGTKSEAKLFGTETQAPRKFTASKSSSNCTSSDTAIKKKSNAEIRGCKSFSTKIEKTGHDSLAKMNMPKTISLGNVEVERIAEQRNDSSAIFKSSTIRDTKEESKSSIPGDERNSSALLTLKNAEKKSDQKSRKSNPSSIGISGRKVISNTGSLPGRRFEQKNIKNIAKKPRDIKNSRKSEICKTEEALLDKDRRIFSNGDYGLEELIRASITEEYLNPDNFESKMNIKNISDWKLIPKKNSSDEQKKSTIYRKFSTPRNPGVETKSDILVTAAKGYEKKIGNIKIYLNRNSKNEPKLENRMGKVKSNFKEKNQTVSQTKICASIDSKLSSIEPSPRFGPKNRGNFAKQ